MSALANDRFFAKFCKISARLPSNRSPDPALSVPEIEEYPLSESGSICRLLQRFFSPHHWACEYILHWFHPLCWSVIILSCHIKTPSLPGNILFI